jgi:hypothetical protein
MDELYPAESAAKLRLAQFSINDVVLIAHPHSEIFS